MISRRIIWAINPFDEEPRIVRNGAVVLRTLSRRASFEVEPTYVVSPAELRAQLEFSVPEKERLQTVAKRALDRVLQKVRLPNLLEPKVLVTQSLTSKATATALSHYAETSGAELIVVATHARRGIDRLFLGSFAEALIVLSHVPVLVFSHQLKPIRRVNTTVFATDFSQESRRVWGRFCKTFSALGAKIVLYHAITKPPKWPLQGGTSIFERSTLKKRQENIGLAKKHADSFLEEAKNTGDRVQIAIEQAQGKVYEAILHKAAKTRASVIGMASLSGKLSATLLGSASRGVMRMSSIPVWIFRA
ncbi:MAG TPA: universal stress protein [Candidatus Binatia bacterium]